MGPVVSYIRVSTGRQGKSGLGIEAQREAVARFAAAEGREVVAEFVEVETGKDSDALDRRPKLAEALAKASLSDTRVGWTAGAGFEWKATSLWSFKLEYLYYDLGTVTTNSQMIDPLFGFPVPNYFVNNVQTTTRFNGNIVRVGLNYKL